MIAYSGLVNNEVRQKCKDAGFQLVIENPLTSQIIEETIIPLLEQRGKNVDIMLGNSSSGNESQYHEVEERKEISQINEISSSKEVSNSIYSKNKPNIFGYGDEAKQKSSEDIEYCLESSNMNSSVPNSSQLDQNNQNNS